MELKYRNLPENKKYRLRSTQEIGNKIFGLKNREKYTFGDFCCHYKIPKCLDEIYNISLCNCIIIAKLFINLYDDFCGIYNKLNNEKEDIMKKQKIIDTKTLTELKNAKLNEKEN